MKKSVDFNGVTIQYNLERKKVKNINLRIKPDGTVCVSANKNVPIDFIEKFIISNADRIILLQKKAESRVKNKAMGSGKYSDGEIILFFGTEMKIRLSESISNYVQITDSHIILYVKDKDNTDLRIKTMENFLKSECQKVIDTYCNAAYLQFKKFGIEYPRIKYRKMISQWGNCQPQKNTLTFNQSLVHAPFKCIEYVVYHEFSHFIHPNHSHDFYNTLSLFLPDWKEKKSELNSIVIR